jgi:hypothetical protein
VLGRRDVANELIAGITPRSTQWRQEFAFTKVPSNDPIAIPAFEVVQVSIYHYPLVNIGGKMLPPIGEPIDLTRLRRSSGIDWIQRKENCPLD